MQVGALGSSGWIKCRCEYLTAEFDFYGFTAVSPLQLQRAEIIPVLVVQEQAQRADPKGIRSLAGVRAKKFAFR